jgi:hypothetical protein
MTQEGLSEAYMKVYATEETIFEPELAGKEDVDGVPCWKITYTATMADGSSYEALVWIGVQDGLPYKSVTQPNPDMTNVVVYYDFNADITIEAPPGVD